MRPISIDDFEEVEALILRGQREGHLLARSREEIAQLLPSCFGYRVGDEHLAGVCSLLTERFHRERAGEITALYTLTRFAGEGVAVELVKQILSEARERPLYYVFACTAEERAAKFFSRLGFRRVGPRDIRRPNGAATIERGCRGLKSSVTISVELRPPHGFHLRSPRCDYARAAAWDSAHPMASICSRGRARDRSPDASSSRRG